MLEFLRGKLVRIEERLAVLDINGIGVEIQMLSTGHLKSSKGRKVTISVCLDLSSGEPRIFGFTDSLDRDLFKAITRIPGIGPVTAFKALFALREARKDGKGPLPPIDGVGPAKHARLENWLNSGRISRKAVLSEKGRVIRDALLALGIPPKEAASKALLALESRPGATIAELIRMASRK